MMSRYLVLSVIKYNIEKDSAGLSVSPEDVK